MSSVRTTTTFGRPLWVAVDADGGPATLGVVVRDVTIEPSRTANAPVIRTRTRETMNPSSPVSSFSYACPMHVWVLRFGG